MTGLTTGRPLHPLLLVGDRITNVDRQLLEMSIFVDTTGNCNGSTWDWAWRAVRPAGRNDPTFLFEWLPVASAITSDCGRKNVGPSRHDGVTFNHEPATCDIFTRNNTGWPPGCF